MQYPGSAHSRWEPCVHAQGQHQGPWELYCSVSEAEPEIIRRALWSPAVQCGPGVCAFVWDESECLCISSYSLERSACQRDPLKSSVPCSGGLGLPVPQAVGLLKRPFEFTWTGDLCKPSQALLWLYDPSVAWGLSFHAEQCCHNGAFFAVGIFTQYAIAHLHCSSRSITLTPYASSSFWWDCLLYVMNKDDRIWSYCSGSGWIKLDMVHCNNFL